MKRLFLSLTSVLGLLYLIAISYTDIRGLPKSINDLLKVSSGAELRNYRADFRKIGRLSADTSKQAEFSRRAERFLKLSPSSDMALVHKGLTKYNQQDKIAAVHLLELAQKRNPRNIHAAYGLFVTFLSQNDFPSAVKQLNLLLRLNKKQTDEYVLYLSEISNIPEMHQDILSELSKNPVWGNNFVKTKISQSDDFDVLISYVTVWANAVNNPKVTIAAQELLLKKMFEANDYDAVTNYKKALSQSEAAKRSIIYDNSFQGYVAPRPLNWRLMKTGQDYAEILNNGGLTVGAKGSAKKVLASQVFVLPKEGDFEFHVHLNGRFTSKTPRFVWQIKCVPSRKVISEINIDKLRGGPQILKAPVMRWNRKCDAHNVSLTALQSNRLQRVKMNIDKVEIIEKPISTREK